MDTLSIQRYLEAVRGSLRTYYKVIVSNAGAFLLGYFTNLVSDSNNSTEEIFIRFMPSTDNIFSFIPFVTMIIVIGVPLLLFVLNEHQKRQRYNTKLTHITRQYVDRMVMPFAKGTIAWGCNLSLAVAPDLREGWSANDIRIEYNGTCYVMPSYHTSSYESYYKRNLLTRRFFDDGDKLMLVKSPTAFSDSPTLLLRLQKTKYSQVQYYRDSIVNLPAERDKLLQGIMTRDEVLFPHSFCMHAFIVTSDDKVLITKRSPKVSYHPSAWSFSIEEQLALDDLEEGNDGVILRWAARLLREELGLSMRYYEKQNVRVLSVFLEGDVMNCSLMCVIHLAVSSDELNQVVQNQPRPDYEFTDWAFLAFEEVREELTVHQRILHPTSEYRMLLALVNRYGVPRVMEFLSHRA